MDMANAECTSFAILFLLGSTFPYTWCERFTIIPDSSDPDSPYPGCHTLQYYAANPSLNDDIILELQPGVHHLENSSLFVSNINSFAMRSNTTAVTVLCSPSAYFSFTRLQEISASGISFIDCKMNLMDIANATFVWSSFTEITRLRCCAVLTFRGSMTLVQIERCTFFKNTMMINNNRAITSYSGAINILNSNFSGFVMAHPPVGHGGALYASRTDVTIINSYFSDNVAAGIGYGGAAAYIYQGIVTVIDSYFSNNIVGGTGGAIHVIRGQLNIDSSNFYNNRANGTGGTVYVSGGDLNVTNTYFTNSTAISNGGALHVFSGEVTISKSHFTNNSASNLGGAAIYIREGEMAIINSSFADNNANTGDLCGAVCTDNGTGLHIFGSNFSDNNVAASGGFSGGALYVDNNENVSIINCYFSNNTASLGNYNGGAICVNRGEVTISNSYFIDNNVATGSNYSGNAIYMHNGGMRVINNSFCNMKPESDYIHVSSGNITIINNLFMIINDTASSGDHHDGIISYFILLDYVNIRLIDNNFNESTAAEYCGLTNTHSTIATTNNSNTTTPSSAINKIVATSESTLEFTLTWGTNSSMKGESITSTINVLFPNPVSATMKNVTSTIQEAITNTIMFVSTTTCTVDKNSVTATTTQTPVHTTTAIVTTVTILPPTSTQSITSPQTSTRPTTVTEEVTEDDGGVDDPTVPFYAYIIISVVLCMLYCCCCCCCCCYFFMRKSRKDPNVEVLRVSSLSIMGDQYTTHPQVSSRL